MKVAKLDFKEEHILFVAKWWADQLRTRAPSPSVERTSDAHLELARSLQQKIVLFGVTEEKLAVVLFGVTEEKLAVFERTLAELLRSSVCPGLCEERTAETWGINGTHSVHLKVDYCASGLLLAACRVAKISDMALPWKTSMFMGRDHAVVRKDGGEPFHLYGEEPCERL